MRQLGTPFIKRLRHLRFDNKAYLLLLTVIAVVSHLIWFIPGSTLFHADWLHWTDEAARQAWQALGTWSSYFGFGTPRIQIGFTFFQDLWSLIANLGASFDTAVKLTLMIPIALLGFLAPYIAMRRLTGDNFVAFVAALFYGTTTYFLLRQGSHLPIALVYALAPLLFLLFANALERMRTKDWVAFGVVYSIGLCSEVRIMYILTFVLFLQALLFFPRKFAKQLPLRLLVAGLVIAGLNSFWLIPTITGSATSVIAETAGRELFGSSLFDLAHAISLSVSSWTGGIPNESFVMQPIPWYLWLIPLILLLPFAMGKRLERAHRRYVLLFAIISVVGIFLTKQALDPLPWAYQWLYDNFPGFSLFREASKFYILTALGYAGLLALGLVALKRNRRLFPVVAAIPIIIAFINLWPLMTGGFGTLFVARHMPKEYEAVNAKISSMPDMNRTLWLPIDSQWAYFDKTHPKVGLAGVIQKEWLPFQEGSTVPEQIASLFKKGVAEDLVRSASIEYIIVPLRDIANEDDFFRYYGDNRQFYIDILSKVPWLKRVDTGSDIAMYEVAEPRPHIAAADSLFALATLDSIEAQRTFVQGKLASGFSLVHDVKGQDKHGIEVSDAFQAWNDVHIQPGKITSTVEAKNEESVLYANRNKPNLSYVTNNNALSLRVAKRNTIGVGGQNIGTSTVADAGAVPMDPTRQYAVAFGDELDLVDAQQTNEQRLGVVTKPVRVLSTDNKNLIANHSLESGLWESQVEDCNPYDNDADIGMAHSPSEHSDGKHSLRLNASKHTACSGPQAVAVTAGHEYLLQFDFKAERSDEVSYQIVFNDPAATVIKKEEKANDKSWHTITKAITVPEGATTLKVKLTASPYSVMRRSAVMYYDNLRLNELRIELDAKLDFTPDYQPIPLQSGKNTIEYIDTVYTGENLIPNASLESGLWKQRVGDCNYYDENPQLRMALSDRASDGGKSLELGARRHTACTGPPEIPVKEHALYLLSFDHQSPNIKTAGYNISFDDPSGQTQSILMPTKKDWQTLTRTIKIPAGAQNIRLSMYGPAQSDGGDYSTVRYDNFKLIEVPEIQDQFYHAGSLDSDLAMPRQVDFTVSNPAKKQAHIKGATKSFFLTMSDSYNPQWRLQINNQKMQGVYANVAPWAPRDAAAGKDDHIKWNNYVNGWYVDVEKLCVQQQHCTQNADGSYDIELAIEFAPQRWFYVGVIVSGLAALGCIVYLCIVSIRSRNRKRKQRTLQADLHTHEPDGVTFKAKVPPVAPPNTPRPVPPGHNQPKRRLIQ